MNTLLAFTLVATLVSPGKGQRMEVAVDTGGALCYRYLQRNTTVVDWSPLGLVADGDEGPAARTEIMAVTKPVLHSGSFPWALGENDTIDDTYTQLTIGCRQGAVAFGLEVRLYEGSAAFRYVLKSATDVRIRRELTAFRLSGRFRLYQYNQESVFTPMAVDSLVTTCDLPATLTNGTAYLSIGEAGNEGYSKAELAAGGGGLVVVYPHDSGVRLAAGMPTPWRTISVSGTAIGLHDCSELNLKLESPAASPEDQHIRPGKLIRAKLTTRAGLDCIDFAAKHHFQYILYDAGWYGAEFRTVSDPSTPIAAIDLPAVIQYGKEKGIGVILYVNYVGLRPHLDSLLPLYKKWGVAGLKFGFVDGLTQDGIRWLAGAMQKVDSLGFILDIHDNYKPTGLSRRWPALLTQEGIRGDENSPDAFHTTVLPFTRFLAGPADFTFCYPNARNSYAKNLKVSKGQQMALTVIYFSPLQSIFWYGDPNDYTDEGDIEFFGIVPTVWNETHYLAGEIGKGISVARRHGDSWYIGNAAGPEGWAESVSLEFLPAGRSYEATIYADDGRGGVVKREKRIKKGDKMELHLPAGGGEALILR